MNLGQFYTENSHVNPVTGCIIWEGDFAKGGTPVIQVAGSPVPVRKVVHDTLNGPQPYRTKYLPSCENDRCVKLEHITVEQPNSRPIDTDPAKLAEAIQLRAEGYRLDIIGQKIGVAPSTISKWLRSTKQEVSDEG